MSDTPIADQAAVAHIAGQHAPDPQPGTALAMPQLADIQRIMGTRIIPVVDWANALIEADLYDADTEEDTAFGLVKAIMLAESSEEVFARMDMRTAKEMLGEEPGARSNALEIYGAFPLKSTYEAGASCFAVVHCRDLAEGVQFSFSTGARAVQAAVLAHMVRGWCPFKATLTRRRRQTQKGFYPLNLERAI